MSFYIGKCKITLSFFFFAVLCICSLSDKNGIYLSGLLAAFIHECGHLLSAVFLKLTPSAVSATSAGLKMHIPYLDADNGKHIIIAVFGALFNIITFAVTFLFCPRFAAANLAICILSLLPADPFDGGRIVHLIIEKFLSQEKAELIMLILTLIVLIFVVTAGTYILIRSRYNFSLLVLSLLIFTTICQRTLK